MKKISITSIVTFIGAITMALPAMATTNATLVPSQVNIVTGGAFTVSVAVNPNGTNNLVEKIVIDYPASILEVVSFTHAPTWMALTQPGYDVTDNITGLLTKTAGYPSGISGATNFGTITFRAKQAGTGIIGVANGSLAFEANSQTAITGNSASVTVSAPAYLPVEKTVKSTATPAASNTKTIAATTTDTSSTSTQTAAVESSGTGWMWTLSIVAILAVVGWGMYIRETVRRV